MSLVFGAIPLRVFLSYHTPDRALAFTLKSAIEAAEPGAHKVFLDQTHLRHGHLWQPALFEEIARADAFLILVSNQLGDWQKVEYYEARDKKAKDDSFILLPVIIADRARGAVPNLPGLSQLHWIESTEPTAREPLAKIISALRRSPLPTPPEPWRTINPYRGLLALEEQDADFFFGRAAETEKILDTVRSKPGRLIALIGNSGVGKSSLVQAGVIGSLKRQRWPGGAQWPAALQDSRGWAYLVMKPKPRGDAIDPIGALASCFASLWFADATDPRRMDRRKHWTERLQAGKARLSDLLQVTEEHFRDGLRVAPPKRVFLYIDQAEELYGSTPNQAGRASDGQSRATADARRKPENDPTRRFSELIAEALPDKRLVVMLSQRADYYGDLQANKLLFPLVELIDIPPLDSDALETVLREPALSLGASFENPDLVGHIVRAAQGQPGALPLLADLMTDLWGRMQKRRDSKAVIRISDEKEIINIGGALIRRAEGFVSQHPSHVNVLRRLFTLRLAHVPRRGEPVRRRMLRSSDPQRQTEWPLVEELADPEWRLLVTGKSDGAATAEVAHEVLLKTWPRLVIWLETERDFIVWRDETEDSRKTYDRASKREKRDHLLSGLALGQAERWLRTRKDDIDPPERKFIEESLRVDWWRRFRSRAAIVVSFLVISALAGVTSWQWYETTVAQRAADAERVKAQRTTVASYKLVADFVDKHRDVAGVRKDSVRKILLTTHETLAKLEASLADDRDLHQARELVLVELGHATFSVGLLKEAQEFFESALTNAERFSKVQPDAPDWWKFLGSAHRGVGHVFRKLGRLDDALAEYQKSVAAYERLKELQSGEKKWQIQRAVSIESIGDIRSDRREWAEALAQYRVSHDIYKRLADDESDEKKKQEWRRELAYPLVEIADVLKEQGKSAEALAHYNDALNIRMKLAAEDPTSLGCECTLAMSHRKIGDLRRALDEPDEALRHYRAALAILERLVLLDPTRTLWAHDLALTLRGAAMAHELEGNPQEAVALLARARQRLAQLRATSRDDVFFQRDMATVEEDIARFSAPIGPP